MAQKFSLLVSAAIVAAAVPPLLSYIPQTSSIFVENQTQSESTQSVPMPNSQPVPYSNSVNQLNDLNSQQTAELNNQSQPQWQAGGGTIHQVGYTPTENVAQTATTAGTVAVNQTLPESYNAPAQNQGTEYTSLATPNSQLATQTDANGNPVSVNTSLATPNSQLATQTDANGNPVSVNTVLATPNSQLATQTDANGNPVSVNTSLATPNSQLATQTDANGNPVSVNTVLATRNSQLATQTNQTGLEQWFRFDITQQWIEQHWDFVTACVGPIQLQGYRVTLVTGPAPDDLTGVITYYFDSRKQLQQILFQGTTGHLGRLTTMLNRQFHMSQRLVNDPALTIYETPASLHSSKNYMEARSPMVIKADQVYHRYEVFLQLNRPAEKQGLIW